MESIEAQEGDEWWVHHGRDLAQYEQGDPLRNWKKGKISQTDSDGSGFWVEVYDADSGDVTAHRLQQRHGMGNKNLMALAKSTLRCVDWPTIVEHKDHLFFGGDATVQGSTEQDTAMQGSTSQKKWNVKCEVDRGV